MKKICLLCAVLLAGCGGGDSYTATTLPEVPQPPGVEDTFLARVQTMILNTRDDAEPINVDTIVATAPEDQEPYTFVM